MAEDATDSREAGYVPTAGKYVGRRSPRAVEMIRFLGQRRDYNDRDPAAQIPRPARHRERPLIPVLGSARRCGRLLPRPSRGNRPARGG
jgi:hypothetical protein